MKLQVFISEIKIKVKTKNKNNLNNELNKYISLKIHLKKTAQYQKWKIEIATFHPLMDSSLDL